MLGKLPQKQRFASSIKMFALGMAVCFIATIWLKSLPYSTSQFAPFEESQAIWRDVSVASQSPEFVNFRAIGTPGTTGLEAAIEVCRIFGQTFHHGNLKIELMDSNYSPVEDLKQHLNQRLAGHCVTRSSLIANCLQSRGIPARVVQIIPFDGDGHNCLEVYDKNRWIFVDLEWSGDSGVGISR